MSNGFNSGLSRRSFLRGAGATSVAVASMPSFAAVTGMVAPRRSGAAPEDGQSSLGGLMTDDLISIGMNENPLGPAQSSLDAIARIAQVSNRYHGETIQATVSTAFGPLWDEARICGPVSGVDRGDEPGADVEHRAGPAADLCRPQL